jgi:hypothetical protein
MRFITGFLIGLVLVVLAQLVIISSGAYDIAATRDDSHIEQWLLSTTMKRSVARRADEVTAPQAFTEDGMDASHPRRSARIGGVVQTPSGRLQCNESSV